MLQKTLKHSIESRRISDQHFVAFTEREVIDVAKKIAEEREVRENEDDAIELALSGWVGDMADDLAVYPRYAPGLSSVLCPPCLSGTQRSSRRACI